MSVKHVLLCMAVLAQGCWVEFPDSRLDDDAGLRRDSSRVDVAVADAPTRDAPRDQRTPDGPSMDRGGAEAAVDGPDPDTPGGDAIDDQGVNCQPNEFMRCDGDLLVTCNEAGTGTESVLCAQGCSEVLRRCRECDPDTYKPRCQTVDRSWIAITCDPDGLIETVACEDTCEEGVCCADGDGDGQSTCQGDCDDGDDRAFLGQEGYFTTPRDDGSFDFDCNDIEEMIIDKVHDCPRTCPDAGWVSRVPQCGEEGKVLQCRLSIIGPNLRCQTGEAQDTTQACR